MKSTTQATHSIFNTLPDMIAVYNPLYVTLTSGCSAQNNWCSYWHRRGGYVKYSIVIAIVACLLGLFNVTMANAQDPVYTQTFMSPIYLNPAATGCGDYDVRVSGIYRRQWWSIPSTMNFMAFSVDKFMPSIHTGVGLIATHSTEGYLTKNGIYGTYAYNICSGTPNAAIKPRWFFNGGLQFGLAQTRVNYRH